MIEAKHIGLCKARHDIMTNDGEEVTDFFFEKIENPHDYKHLESMAWCKFINIGNYDESMQRMPERVYLYVTGLTMALTSVLKIYESKKYRFRQDMKLSLMHFDRESNTYKEQMWVEK